MAQGIVEQEQNDSSRHPVTPERGPVVEANGHRGGVDPRRREQGRQRRRGVDRALAGGMAVQGQEDLAVRKTVRQHVRGVYREGRLADAGHAIDREKSASDGRRAYGGCRVDQVL